MGIRTWPGYELFGDDCNACFDPGKTPKKIYVTFTGIKVCPWATGVGVTNAPNRTFVLDQEPENCTWHYWDGKWSVYYYARNPADPANALLVVSSFIAFGTAMFKAVDVKCTTYFQNIYVPGDCIPLVAAGHGGEAQCFWRPAESSPSIRGIMEKLNIEPEKQTFAEVFPVDDDNLVLRLARQKDATNIKIKFEHTL